MNMALICMGKLKEKYWRDAIAEYSKRLSRYMKLEIIELADEKAPETMSPAQEAEVKEKEGQRILKNVKDDAFVVALAVEGKQLSSEELASFVGRKHCISCAKCLQQKYPIQMARILLPSGLSPTKT